METIWEALKNPRDLVRISVGEYKGSSICDFRIWYQAEPGLWKPSPRGLAFSISLLPEIIEALKVAEQQLKGGVRYGHAIQRN